MVPIRTSWIFRSRWMALVWAGGILWFTYTFASPRNETANASDNEVQITHATGAPISPAEAKRLEEALKNL